MSLPYSFLAEKHKAMEGGKISVLDVVSTSEAMRAARLIQAGEAVVVNTFRLNRLETRKALNLISESVSSNNGFQEKIAEHIYLYTPGDVVIRNLSPMS